MGSVGEEELSNHPPGLPRVGLPNPLAEALALIPSDGAPLRQLLLLPTTTIQRSIQGLTPKSTASGL